jgi:LysR family transcriptional regulator, transcriptional activator for bauABCD operon
MRSHTTCSRNSGNSVSVLDGSAVLGVGVVSREYPEINAYPLFEEVISLYCGPGHPLYDVPDASITPAELAKHECVDLPYPQHLLGMGWA